MNKSAIELLKDLSAIIVGAAAALYVCGYLVHLGLYRVLGVEVGGLPLDYIRLAGDYAFSLIISLVQLFVSFSQYYPRLIEFPLLIGTIASLALGLFLVLARVLGRTPPSFWRGVLVAIYLLVTFAAVFWFELQMVKVKNVLQPVDAAQIQRMQPEGVKDISTALADRREDVKRVYTYYEQEHHNDPGFKNWRLWFDPYPGHSTAGERTSTYLALLLLNVLIVAGALWQLRSGIRSSARGVRFFVAEAALILCIQMFLLPFVYATLGRYFTYPVVSLRLAAEGEKDRGGAGTSKPSESSQSPVQPGPHNIFDATATHAVYLITQTDSEVVVYDRLAFFQIKHIPRSKIIAINQLFYASPFDSCSVDFLPCEGLWIPESKEVLDF